jgi:hypothetical protein
VPGVPTWVGAAAVHLPVKAVSTTWSTKVLHICMATSYFEMPSRDTRRPAAGVPRPYLRELRSTLGCCVR